MIDAKVAYLEAMIRALESLTAPGELYPEADLALLREADDLVDELNRLSLFDPLAGLAALDPDLLSPELRVYGFQGLEDQ